MKKYIFNIIDASHSKQHIPPNQVSRIPSENALPQTIWLAQIPKLDVK